MSKISELISFCKSGNLSYITSILECKSLNTKQYLISRKSSDGSTCLITACKNGHKSIIEYLLNSCYADIEQKGNISIENELIEGVTPLWCAAAVGSLSVVQLLLKLGADVNHGSITHSTPLRAACYDGHLEVAKCLVFHGADIEQANRFGHTCLMVSCFRGHTAIVEFLLIMGARVNRKGHRGNTALHDCAEAGNVALYRMLLSHGASPLKDDFGNSPIMTAALFGHENLISELDSNLSTSERADVYQLLGCYFVDKNSLIERGIAHWYRSQHIRDNDVTCRKQQFKLYPGLKTSLRETQPILKTNIEPKKTMVLLSPGIADLMEIVFSRVSEFSSVDDLIRLLDFPDFCNIQSLLIRVRILGPDNPDTLSYLRRYGASMLENGEAMMCINSWRLLLELQHLYIDPLSPMVNNTFLSFVEMFIHILSDRYPGVPRRELKVSLIVTCLHYAIDAISKCEQFFYQKWRRKQPWAYTKADKESFNLHYLTRLSLHFVHLMETYYRTEDSDQEALDPLDDGPVFDKMEMPEPIRIWYLKCVFRLVKLDPRFDQDFSIIHLCVRPDTGPLSASKLSFHFPSYCVTKRLLKMGYNGNQSSSNGVRPINLIFSLTQPEFEPVRGRLLRLILIKGGAHLDVRGHSFSFPKLMKHFSLNNPYAQKCLLQAGLSPIQFISLKCLCAKSIVENKLNYVKCSHLSKNLKEFISLH